MSREQFNIDVNALLKFSDRKQVWLQVQRLPVPYALAFLRVNRNEIDFWRRVASANMELPDSYVRAIFAYGTYGVRGRINYPQKKKAEDVVPLPFRENDKYWREIVANFKSVANEVRDKSDTLPKGMRKTRDSEVKWV